MRSLTPGRPGGSMQAPRTIRSIDGAGLAGAQQRLDQRRVGERIDLDDDARRPPGARGVGYLLEQCRSMRRCSRNGAASSWRGGAACVWLAICWNTASASAVSAGSAVRKPTSVYSRAVFGL